MRKERIAFIVLMLILIAIAMMFLPRGVGAGPELPEGLGVFYLDTGQACVYNESSLEWDCYCPCYQGWCLEEFSPGPTVSPTDEKPVPSETPVPTEETKCNSGRGNGSEGDPDCDPGNSGKNQGGD